MQSDYTGLVTSAEWRWVTRIASALVGLAALPLLWLLLHGTTGDHREFMGVLHGYQSSAIDLTRIFQGKEGDWLTHYLHTPEPHGGTLIGVFYALLGQLARLTTLAPMVIFHIARCGAAMVMYLSLYLLPSSIWMKSRSRRVFFIIVVLGGGFGWFLTPLTGATGFIDLNATNVFPFFSTLVNVHYPLTIACLALLASVIIAVLRPGNPALPTVENGGLTVFLLSLFLAFIHPLALVPIALAFIFCLNIDWYQRRAFSRPQLQWLMWFGVPALPMIAYYISVAHYNRVAGELWIAENTTPAAAPLYFLLGVGFPLLIALPGIYRAARRFEPDGDRFMLVWLVVMLLLTYLPTVFHQHFAIGFMIPLAYFATRSIEDFWLNFVTRRWRLRLFAALIPLMSASLMLMLVLPMFSSTASTRQSDQWLLEEDYVAAFHWLRRQAGSDDVVLSAPEVGLWIPVRTGARVVYGHPRLTLDAAEKERAVWQWYRETDPARCLALLQGEYSFDRPYTVRYIVVGPREQATTVCLAGLRVFSFDTVQIYVYSPADLGSE